eukprot:TRINITY_DN54_c2_g1_i1.p1 TRINITY_DN54_c2_g1~~TRINITY_DN54_c2_g1_i1.p1  ORF type:complete len:828 (+),score=165.20 TRINITY_DN54_c2_g1_i1:111-2594(+)
MPAARQTRACRRLGIRASGFRCLAATVLVLSSCMTKLAAAQASPAEAALIAAAAGDGDTEPSEPEMPAAATEPLFPSSENAASAASAASPPEESAAASIVQPAPPPQPAAAAPPAAAVPQYAMARGDEYEEATPGPPGGEASAATPPPSQGVVGATFTTTVTTTPKLLTPPPLTGTIVPGLVSMLYDLKTKETTVVAIDKSAHHWGEVWAPMAMKWKGILFIQQPGTYRFQMIFIGSAELRIDNYLLIKHSGGQKGNTSAASPGVILAAGYHDIDMAYAEQQGRAGFVAHYIGPDTNNRVKLLPAQNLYHTQGPCDLRSVRGLGRIACGTSDSPRWALESGESCQAHCSWSRHPYGNPEGSRLVQCYDGKLTPPDFMCGLLRCDAPQVGNASEHSSCQEGATILDGKNCTPSCAPGFAPKTWGMLKCSNGTMLGSFLCVPKKPCTPPDQGLILHARSPTCTTGPQIPHGATCGPACLPGFEASSDLACKDGILDPPTFSCDPLPTTITTTLPPSTSSVAAIQVAHDSASGAAAWLSSLDAKKSASSTTTTTEEAAGLFARDAGSSPEDSGGGLPWQLLLVLILLPIAMGTGGILCWRSFAAQKQRKKFRHSDTRRSMSETSGVTAGSDVESHGTGHWARSFSKSDSSESEDEDYSSSVQDTQRMPLMEAQQQWERQQQSRQAQQSRQQEQRLQEQQRLREEQQRLEERRRLQQEQQGIEEQRRLQERLWQEQQQQLQEQLRLQEQQRQQQQQMQRRPTQEQQQNSPERILGSSYRPMSERAPKSSPPTSQQRRYAEESPGWSDVRVGDNRHKVVASQVPWSDIRIGE